MSISVSDFIRLALMEIRVARAGDVVNPDDMADSLLILNELLDAFNADERALYTQFITSFTLTPNLQPHTIGVSTNVPAPTWNVTIARPMKVLAANLIISSNIRMPLNLRDDAWWMDLRARAVTSAIPTDLFYSPDWPNGSVSLWPVPMAAYSLELEYETLLASLASGDTFDLPPGYQQALRLTLAERLAPAFGQSLSSSTERRAREARALIWGNNDAIPNLVTRDAGMPGGSGGGFNYRTGQVS